MFGGTFGRAVAGGAAASSVGTAFLAGYRAALARLVPSLPPERAACLCASEEGGAHPRAIATTLRATDGGGWRLDGRKKWVTGAPHADVLLVVASIGVGGGVDADGRNRLKLARVDAKAPGVTFHPLSPTPFVPEIPHAEVSFDDVAVDELYEGDGYDRYLKPFRTIEDAHVFGAVLAWLGGRGPRAFAERTFAVLAALEKVAAGDASSRALHLVLGGALALGRELAAEAAQFLDGEEKERWLRDSALLNVAGKARAARSESAWKALAGA